MGVLQEVAAVRKGPRITNLFFADDCLLFSKARMEDCMKQVKILEVYKQASRYEVNVSKFEIMFSKNTINIKRQKAMEILRISRSME